jgi:hypothetical protein
VDFCIGGGVLTIASRNFTGSEVARRPIPPELTPVAYFLMGTAQAIRDRLCIALGRDVALKITSGYRSPAVNAATEGAAANSNHVWTISKTGKILKCAMDIAPVNCTLEELFKVATDQVRGEVYMNRAKGFVHVAPCGPIKKPFIR